jgi:hypothetical protein
VIPRQSQRTSEGSVERGELEKLPEGELLRRAAREAAIAVTVVGHAFLRQPEAIIYKPGELAVLFRALTACVQAVSAVTRRAIVARLRGQ